eukprot:TRINITY_DN8068_c1_g1_i1.p1 TRINITY_DN8068_c1_g1~~TRINITY_DN8068_c1_g1_i1.p1  ORF type:complete len:221 (+),score=24.98 TRINITY_DN8068_c1_g1_i1:46-708(+)
MKTRPPMLRSSPTGAVMVRSRSASALLGPHKPKNANMMDFFAHMEREMNDEWQDISEMEQAINATRRAQRQVFGESGALPEPRRARRGTGRGPLPPPRPPRTKLPSTEVGEGAEIYLKEWQKHDEAWMDFQNSCPCPLSVEHVPWPPCKEDVLEFCQRLQAPGKWKTAYRIACRRWHPDKFFQLYGSNISDDEEKAGLTLRLNDIFQAVTKQYERCQHKR